MDKLKGFAKLLWWLQAREVAFFKANWVVWGENRTFGVFFYKKLPGRCLRGKCEVPWAVDFTKVSLRPGCALLECSVGLW